MYASHLNFGTDTLIDVPQDARTGPAEHVMIVQIIDGPYRGEIVATVGINDEALYCVDPTKTDDQLDIACSALIQGF